MNLLVIDIGGTSVQLALCDTSAYTLSERTQFLTPRANIGSMHAMMVEHIQTHYAADAYDGIAISTAGVVEKEKGAIGKGSFFYEGFGKTILADLSAVFAVPISIENDGNCAALSEYWMGNGRGTSSLTTIVIGTAIGGAIIVDGKIIRGFHNLAGEYGFILYAQQGGTYRIWSEEGSTQSIVQQYAEGIPHGVKVLDGKALFELANSGDACAQMYVDKLILHLAEQCYNIQYILDPEVILIGGGISANPTFIESVNKKIALIGASKRQTVVLPRVLACKFANDANLYGAAYDWLQENKHIV